MRWVQHNIKREIGGNTVSLPLNFTEENNLYKINAIQDLTTGEMVAYSLVCLYSNGTRLGEYKTLKAAQLAAEKHMASRRS